MDLTLIDESSAKSTIFIEVQRYGSTSNKVQINIKSPDFGGPEYSMVKENEERNAKEKN